MAPEPLYRPADLRRAYQLRYGWTGWPSKAPIPSSLLARVIPDIASEWETDGLRVLESSLASEQLQLRRVSARSGRRMAWRFTPLLGQD